ncbi:MAG TPA: hypothetical protein VE397_16345 [Stellaceae bacterium]|jgi:hypothetical protein|nr:hypothetical protein [Stellaceae bacterium]
MARFVFGSIVLVPLCLACAACGTSTGADPKSAGYLSTPDAPLVAPVNQNDRSDATAGKQRESGYFPAADAPLTAPDGHTPDPSSTQKKQQNSGYFPAAGSPLVPPTTSPSQ